MIIFLVNCLLKNDSGFIIDEIGFEDNTQIISKGRLFWSEIQTIENSSLVSMNVIKINFKDSSQKPRYFSSALLKISQAELFEKLNSKFKETTANRR